MFIMRVRQAVTEVAPRDRTVRISCSNYPPGSGFQRATLVRERFPVFKKSTKSNKASRQNDPLQNGNYLCRRQRMVAISQRMRDQQGSSLAPDSWQRIIANNRRKPRGVLSQDTAGIHHLYCSSELLCGDQSLITELTERSERMQSLQWQQFPGSRTSMRIHTRGRR